MNIIYNLIIAKINNIDINILKNRNNNRNKLYFHLIKPSLYFILIFQSNFIFKIWIKTLMLQIRTIQHLLRKRKILQTDRKGINNGHY